MSQTNFKLGFSQQKRKKKMLMKQLGTNTVMRQLGYKMIK